MVGIDCPLSCARQGERSRPDERALARAICGIRWTPERHELAGNPYYEWIEHGLELRDALADAAPGSQLIEVFPTAAWTVWHGPRGKRPRAEWSAEALRALEVPGAPGSQSSHSTRITKLSQDERDAIAAALTARLYAQGRSQSFGEIVVPRMPSTIR